MDAERAKLVVAIIKGTLIAQRGRTIEVEIVSEDNESFHIQDDLIDHFYLDNTADKEAFLKGGWLSDEDFNNIYRPAHAIEDALSEAGFEVVEWSEDNGDPNNYATAIIHDESE